MTTQGGEVLQQGNYVFPIGAIRPTYEAIQPPEVDTTSKAIGEEVSELHKQLQEEKIFQHRHFKAETRDALYDKNFIS